MLAARQCPHCGGTYPPEQSLTQREAQLMALLAHGRNTRRMADVLCISIKTVETHMQHIKAKLQLADTYELVAYAVRGAAMRPTPAQEEPRA